MLVVMFYSTLFRHISSGPNSKRILDHQGLRNCHKYWWTNLLYINNIYPMITEDENKMVRTKHQGAT